MSRKIEIEKTQKVLKVEYSSGRKIELGGKKGKGKSTVKVAESTPESTTDTKPKNGHAKAITRKLDDEEKAIIRREFLKLNGVIEEDSCLKIKEKLADDVTIFQVVGMVAALHRAVAAGSEEVKNKKAYGTAIRAHRKEWLTYSGEKYDAMREKANNA